MLFPKHLPAWQAKRNLVSSEVEGRATSVEGHSRGIREANGAILKQASRQACLPESLIRKRRFACPSTALRL